MSDTNMAMWVAHIENQQHTQAFDRQQKFLDDILPDDYAVRLAYFSRREESHLLRDISQSLKNSFTALTRRITASSGLEVDTSLTEECLGC